MDGQPEPAPTETILVSGSNISDLNGTYTLMAGSPGTNYVCYSKYISGSGYRRFYYTVQNNGGSTFEIGKGNFQPGPYLQDWVSISTLYYTSSKILGPYSSSDSSYDPPPTVTYI